MWNCFKSYRTLYSEAVEVLRKATHFDAPLMHQRFTYEVRGKPADQDKDIGELHNALAEFAIEFLKEKAQPDVLDGLAAKISSLETAIKSRSTFLQLHQRCLRDELRPSVETAIKGVKEFAYKWQTMEGRYFVTQAEALVEELKAAKLADAEALNRTGRLSEAAMDQDLHKRMTAAREASDRGRSSSSSYRSYTDYSFGGTSTSTMGGGAC